MADEQPVLPVRIAVVEDNPADVYLLQKTLQKIELNCRFFHCARA